MIKYISFIIALFLAGCGSSGGGGTTPVVNPPPPTVVLPVEIITQPVSIMVNKSATATFSVAANNATGYQWQCDGNVIGTESSISWNTVMADNGKQLCCVVSNSIGSVTSNTVTLTVLETVPIITTHPVSVTCYIGNTITISVNGDRITHWNWQYSINGGVSWLNSTVTSSEISWTAARTDDEMQIRCIVSNDIGETVTSNVASIDILSLAPIITIQPISNYLLAGQTATLTVVATNATSYQWEYGYDGINWNRTGTRFAGLLNLPSFSFTSRTTDNRCMWRCIVSNANGDTISNVVYIYCVSPVWG